VKIRCSLVATYQTARSHNRRRPQYKEMTTFFSPKNPTICVSPKERMEESIDQFTQFVLREDCMFAAHGGRACESVFYGRHYDRSGEIYLVRTLLLWSLCLEQGQIAWAPPLKKHSRKKTS
jgi:hypothetical protein